eukprot:PhM_4_TR10948/c1_g1_i1/m.88493/K15448/TRM112, TRMT112; multifunctional methyltransferase subunit TRM112
MRLFTHNFLQCVKCQGGYPLVIKDDCEVELCEADFEPDFIRSVLDRIDITTLKTTIDMLGIHDQLPCPLPKKEDGMVEEGANPPMDVLRTLHMALNGVEVVKGEMKCDKCGQVYQINDRIPNMVVV